MSNKDFNIYLCGGGAINVGNLILSESRHGHYIEQMVGLDTSTANKAIDNSFPIERLEGTEGSGSDKSKNMHLYKPFVKQTLAKYEPNKINIVVYTASGGTGAGVGPHLVRELLELDLPVLSMVIGDDSSMKELNNTVSTLRSLAAQTQLGVPVCFCYHVNKDGLTHTAVNRSVVASIDAALLTLNLGNERVDYADICNLFFFNKVVDADPILTQMTFLLDEDLGKYDRQAIAAISLFKEEESIRVPFPDLMYRKAGLFGEINAGFTSGCHAILDHGSTLHELEVMMETHKKRTDAIGSRFRAKTSAVIKGGDGDGMFC